MNLFKLIKLKKDYSKLEDQVDQMDTKHLLLSKTFWVNIAQFGLDIAGVIPQKWHAPVFLVSNIILRLLSNQGTTLSPSVLLKTIGEKLNK